MSEALYRKYRPQVFEDVVGQEPIERTLKNAVSQDKVSHAYLFCGPRGTGKTTTARLLSKALLCEHGPTPEPDGTCDDCQLVAEGAHPDVYELDAASRTGVDNVRDEIISRVHFAPTRGRYKVYIIDEVHMLSTAAFNALLKTLEEPPSHVVFVLCTTDPQKVPETIHSRCQRFDFHRISPEAMVARLGAVCMAEGVPFEGEALDLIAQRADGGLRDALTSLEQIIAFENGSVTLAGAERLLGSIDSNDMAEIMAYIGRRDIANCFQFTARYVETGADLAQFVRDMAEHVRNLYVMALVGEDAGIDVTETNRQQLASELSWFGPDRASRLLGVLGDLTAELKTTSNPRLAFEIALTRMVRPDSDLTLEALAERVEALESGYSAVAHVLPGPAYVPAAEPREQTAPVAQPAPQVQQEQRVQQAQQVQQAQPAQQVQQVQQVQEPAFAPHKAAEAAPEPVSHAQASQPSRDTQAAAALQDSPTSGVSTPQQASQQPEQPAGANSALANPAALQRIWQAALAEVKQRKQAHGVLFMGAKASYDAARGMLRIVFPAESTFAFNAVQKPDVQEVLSEALQKALGEPVAFCFDKAGSAPSQQPVSGPAMQAASQQPQHVQQLQPAQQPQQAQQAQQAQQMQRAHQAQQAQPVQQMQQAQPAQQPAQVQQPAAREQQPQSVAQSAQPAWQQPAQEPATAPQADAASSASPGYDASPSGQAPYDGPSYDDEPPYDDEAYYDYGSYDEPYDPAPFPAQAPQAVPLGGPTGQAGANAAGAGAAGDDPAALQAMLQASFGASVTFSETDE